MKLHHQDQLLDVKVRKQIIDDIVGPANVQRKTEAKKRHEVFKDKTVKYVLKKLENEGLSKDTLQLMSNRASNISICRKIIMKKAKCYNDGVMRETGKDADLNQKVSYLAMMLGFDEKKKKADRYLQLLKNCMSWFIPEHVGEGKFIIRMKVMGSWQYDAVENVKNMDSPLAIILSDFSSSAQASTFRSGPNQVTGNDASATVTGPQAIALGGEVTKTDEPDCFIFWSDKYHFTCNRKGEIIPQLTPDDNLNPIGMIPGVAMAKDRDDSFWATGGEDLVDGSILVNTLLTDMFSIQFMQGWGQFVITGSKGCIPETMAGGPHRAITMTYDNKKGQAKPEVTVVNSNPPITSWMATVEQYVALLLSTNNLSPRVVAGKLDASNMASGIALMIERSDSSEDVTDAQADMARGERKEWRIYTAWHNRYHASNSLDAEFALVGKLPQDIDVTAKFTPAGEVVTEKERLENMKLKKDLGLVRQVELLMAENPGMTEEEAEQKLLKIKAEAIEQVRRELKDGSAQADGEQTETTDDSETPAPAAGSEVVPTGDDVQKTALNGAQVTSMVDIVTAVAVGELPRDSAVEMIMASFPFIDKAWAERIIGSAGKGFKVQKPEPPAPQGGGKQNDNPGSPKD